MPSPSHDEELLVALTAFKQAMHQWFDRQPEGELETLGGQVQSLGMAVNAQIDHYCHAHTALAEDVIFFTLGCVLIHRARHPQTLFSATTFGEEDADA